MLANVLKSARNQHLQLHNALVESSDRSLYVYVPKEREESSGASMFGDLAKIVQEPERLGPFQCLWYDSVSSFTNSNHLPFQLTGSFPEMKAVAVLKLEDILTDPTDPYSETLLDKAKTVASAGHLYNVLGFTRDGMATGAPYMATVVLSGEVQRVEL